MIQSYKSSRKYVRDNILKYRISLLKQAMNRFFFEIVRVCIKDDFSQLELSIGDISNAKTLYLSFKRLVVSQLNKFSI